MTTRKADWSLKTYVNGFFPSIYAITFEVSDGEIRHASLRVTDPTTGIAVEKESVLTDFLDICLMAEIAKDLKRQLRRKHLSVRSNVA